MTSSTDDDLMDRSDVVEADRRLADKLGLQHVSTRRVNLEDDGSGKETWCYGAFAARFWMGERGYGLYFSTTMPIVAPVLVSDQDALRSQAIGVASIARRWPGQAIRSSGATTAGQNTQRSFS